MSSGHTRKRPKVIITDNRNTYATNNIEQVLNTSNTLGILSLISILTVNVRPMLTWLKERLTEKSTFQGLIGLMSAIGMTVNPEMIESIVALAVSLISVIEITRKENGKEETSN